MGLLYHFYFSQNNVLSDFLCSLLIHPPIISLSIVHSFHGSIANKTILHNILQFYKDFMPNSKRTDLPR